MSKHDIPEDFRIKMRDFFIPAVEEMAKKEEEHLNFLRETRLKLINRQEVDQYIKRSTRALEHYKLRLQQYRDFIA